MAKDVKNLLKEAREAIKNKDFQTSLKLCKNILKEDKDNYMGLVFFGISLQETGPTNQAPNAFKRAIQINSDNILAWNGLANYYEKQEDDASKKELLNVYTKMLNLESNEKKIVEICEKIISNCSCCYQPETMFNAISKIIEKQSFESKSTIWQMLVAYLSKLQCLSEHLLKIYADGLMFLIGNSKTTTVDYYSNYLKVLHKQNKYELLITEAQKMHQMFNNDMTSLEWICKIYNESQIEGNELMNISRETVTTYCDLLLNKQPKSSMGLFTKSIAKYNSMEYLETKDLLNEVLSNRPGLLHAWYLLSKCLDKLQLYEEAFEAASKVDKLLQSIKNGNETMRVLVDLVMAEVLSKDENLNLSLGEEKCEMLLQNNINNYKIIVCLVRIYISSKKFSKAREMLSKLKELNAPEHEVVLLNICMLIKKKMLNEAAQLAEKNNLENFDYYIATGKLYWDLEQFDKSLAAFLKAAKIKPQSYLAFFHLGNYYEKINEYDKARRCFERAFKINNKCIAAGIELTKIYRKQKKWDANLNLLENLTSRKVNSDNQWAYLQLGMHFLEQENFEKAIDVLQLLVRAHFKNSHYWESLGDAYLARGSYTSALKSYQQAVVLTDEKTLYPLLQIANIKQTLGQYTEARQDFKNILNTNKKYIPALKGLAETCMCLARMYKRNQLFGLARDCVQCSLDNITEALQERADMSCLWKITADSCFLVASFPERYCCMLVVAALAEGKNVTGNKILEKDELYTLAARCYYKALSLVSNNVLIWHDLSACFLSYALSTENKEISVQLYEKALGCVQHCIKENPLHWQHWNLLGNIAFHKESKNYSLAQHAFIKAVTIEHNSAISWCNLGVLYLCLDDIKLANEAFSQAQRSDPNYINSWVGQALIAEYMDHEDAMDLFRHSTQLGFHKESALGYSHWVCQTLLQAPPHTVIYAIHNMYAVSVALDAITWYTENNPEDACAWNILGILNERMGLKLSAASAFRKASTFCERNYRDIANVNYGRLLIKLGKYSQAVNVFEDIREATFNSGSGLALALFKDKEFQKSYDAYETALNWLTEEQSFQSDLLVALASMAYLFQGPEEAKNLLFQSTQLKPPSPWGLYATLSLGLLHDDINLALLVLKEIRHFQDDMKCLPHYATIMSYTYLLQGEKKKAIREVSKLIHRHPDQGTVWLTLATLLLRLHEHHTLTSAAAKCAQVAMKLGRNNMDVTKVLCLVSMISYLISDYNSALKYAQKAIHCYPDITEGWSALICTLSTLEKKKIGKNMNVNKVIDVHHKLNCSSALSKWFKQF